MRGGIVVGVDAAAIAEAMSQLMQGGDTEEMAKERQSLFRNGCPDPCGNHHPSVDSDIVPR